MAYLGDHWEVVGHVCVQHSVDNHLPDMLPLCGVQAGQNVDLWLLMEQIEQSSQVTILEHADVIVCARQRVMSRYQECIADACAA